jgi:hypothetical protein
MIGYTHSLNAVDILIEVGCRKIPFRTTEITTTREYKQ